MEIQPRQRNALIVGALMGALLGAGTAWLLVTDDSDSQFGEARKPLGPGEILKFTARIASLLREMDEMRRRM